MKNDVFVNGWNNDKFKWLNDLTYRFLNTLMTSTISSWHVWLFLLLLFLFWRGSFTIHLFIMHIKILLCTCKFCLKKEKKGPVLKCVLLYVCVWVHACVVCVGVGWGGDYEYAVFLLCISVSFIVSSRVLYCCTWDLKGHELQRWYFQKRMPMQSFVHPHPLCEPSKGRTDWFSRRTVMIEI